METIYIILGVLGAILLLVLIIIGLYVVILLRKSNQIVQKVDYLIEDITYKVEALTPTFDIINKFSNYAIAADAMAGKSLKGIIAFFIKNQASLLKTIQSIIEIFNKTWSKTSSNKHSHKTKKDDINLKKDKVIIEDDEGTHTNTFKNFKDKVDKEAKIIKEKSSKEMNNVKDKIINEVNHIKEKTLKEKESFFSHEKSDKINQKKEKIQEKDYNKKIEENK